MSGQRVLVTGGAGFLGSHFIRAWLARHPSDEIVVLDALTYAGSRARLADAEETGRCHFVHGDICHAALVRTLMRDCQAVVHFAAETHVDRSITDAAPFLRTNVEGTYTLLREAAACEMGRFIHISTDEVYGPVLDGAADESSSLAPRSPYAASKAAGDLLVQAYWATHRLPAIVVRPTNVFGPAQSPEKFIPLCITNGDQGLPLPLYGDGQQRRAWLYVEDLCDALEVILERGRPGEIYNVASGKEQSNLETATMILAQMGCPIELIQFVADRPGHDRRYAMRDGRLRAFGWQPKVSFERGLTETIAWYRGHDDWWRPLVQQLREDPYHWLNRPARARAGLVPGAPV